jgi:hypothetical protein
LAVVRDGATNSETKSKEVAAGLEKSNLCNPSSSRSQSRRRKIGGKRKGRYEMEIRRVDKITRTRNEMKTIEPECRRAR